MQVCAFTEVTTYLSIGDNIAPHCHRYTWRVDTCEQPNMVHELS
mgnify:CR=1 FL=1